LALRRHRCNKYLKFKEKTKRDSLQIQQKEGNAVNHKLAQVSVDKQKVTRKVKKTNKNQYKQKR